ncbi:MULTISPECIES: SGNH/GDSL hydrolase family protein [unclassified Rhodococcus (in: high G+C Gram-positive bacteria)]|uniref:SGNH/GDSL hydrolase family protein n=1 Tax=unclassified Rhodococcus (in: high G+C Gram-positive bacteria) TaxID=192944 RepID=UPI00163A4A0E|nr:MULTISPECIES: SGNH/GDSL hydrolase family protein [unclassified Rhodococcus (in: high G+C Gram-positive bacteria)]MBC2642709.1 SGNH/GDSL hydrolase family protein [Rhodococcus sp. 3A]MBC2892549.1 SGNH/GDSL hydrolase family protein [Rhodococcus sp. 4CII]
MSKKPRSVSDVKRDPKTVAFWSFIAFAIVAGAGMYYANEQRTPPASAIAPYTPGPAPAQVNSKLAILGDSYTAGAGAAIDEGFGQQVAALFCWDGAYFGQGGTGYTNPGQPAEGESAYLQRVNAVIEASPDVVVIQGSTNDDGGEDNTDKARKVFSAIRAGLPNAQIIALGPVAPPKEDPARVAASRDAVRAAADGEGIPFIDPIAAGWMPGSFNFGEDGINLNRFGHKLMAENVFGSIRQLNLPNLTRC